MRYEYMTKQIFGPLGITTTMTVDELITLIARQTTLVDEQIKERLLAAINDMTENYEPKVESK